MKVAITDADNKELQIKLNFSLLEEKGKYQAKFNLLNPFSSENSSDSKTVFGYSLILNQLSIFSSPEDFNQQLIEKSCIFYYDCDGKGEEFPVILEIEKEFYDQINQIKSDYEYEVTWKKNPESPSIEYIYKEDKEKFIYYTKREKKVKFDSTIVQKIFTKETQILDLTNLDNEENFFIPGLSNFEIIGFKNESFSNKETLQIIPLNSEMIFIDDNDTKRYVFSLVIEKKENFPLDFFIKNIDINNEGTPPSGGGSGTEEDGTGGLASIDTITNDEINELFGITA